jgi:hypothetical protein
VSILVNDYSTISTRNVDPVFENFFKLAFALHIKKKCTGSIKDSGIRFLCHVGMQTDVELSTSTIKTCIFDA